MSSLALAFGGCAATLEELAKTCPDPDFASTLVDWTPDIARPVGYGMSQFVDAELMGRPSLSFQIYYPSDSLRPVSAPMLKQCLARWPLVVLLHGQEPFDCHPHEEFRPQMHRQFTALASLLASSGYVVLVPGHPAHNTTHPDYPEFDGVLTMMEWVRNHWIEHRWIDPDPARTVLIGHSFGAGIAALIAQRMEKIAAFVSLSAPWRLFDDAQEMLAGNDAPSLFAWATGQTQFSECNEDLFDPCPNAGALWPVVSPDKYAIRHRGEHYDLLFDEMKSFGQCTNPLEPPCSSAAAVRELIALFVARYSPVNISNLGVTTDLQIQPVFKTDAQKIYGDVPLPALAAFVDMGDCAVRIDWETEESSAMRLVGA